MKLWRTTTHPLYVKKYESLKLSCYLSQQKTFNFSPQPKALSSLDICILTMVINCDGIQWHGKFLMTVVTVSKNCKIHHQGKHLHDNTCKLEQKYVIKLDSIYSTYQLNNFNTVGIDNDFPLCVITKPSMMHPLRTIENHQSKS